MGTVTTVLFRSICYNVVLPELISQPLVQVFESDGKVTELIHPVDCLRLGVHNGGYFNSQQSRQVHGYDRTLQLLDLQKLYFGNKISLLPSYYLANSQSSRFALANQGREWQNYFGVSASSTLDQWQANGWIQPSAPEGWFEAYAQLVAFGLNRDGKTVYSGYDNWRTDWAKEQKRMLSFVARHSGQIRANCQGDLTARLKQRQALLNWASPLAFL